jgi:thioredoxin-related protein
MQKWKGLFLLAGVLVFACAERPAVRVKSMSASEIPAVPLAPAPRLRSPAASFLPLKDKSGSISWISVEEAAGKLQNEKRPVLIDLYTTWCGWCKQMDRKTYSNKQVAQYLQEKFYPVKVDAETHAVIKWNGRSYQFSPDFRSNEFAIYLTGGRLEFPTTIIIPPGGEPQAIPGYMEPKELELLVRYFGEGDYNKVSFDNFQKRFKPSW